MISGQLPLRGIDDWGSGEFGAGRGNRTHKGVDYSCYPDTRIVAPVSGRVTKLGFPYSDSTEFRYVQVTDIVGNRHRIFYVEPTVAHFDFVKMGDVIGTAQDIADKYTTRERLMKNHVHYEIYTRDGDLINPEEF